jgi:CRP-like cAMP-binding protein
MNAHYDPRQNHLLAALSPAEQERIFPYLELVPMPLGKVLCESGDVQRNAYFPVDCIVSLLNVLHDGRSAELGIVGNDGIVGISLFMGGGGVPCRAVVQCGGYAYCLAGQRLTSEFANADELQLLLLRYTHSLIAEIAQTAVCNRHHSISQQLCRWLLLALDRVASPAELTVTHELVANMLGVRRESVTAAAGTLRQLGVIAYKRGQLRVLDRSLLERLSCECYEVVHNECNRLRHSVGHYSAAALAVDHGCEVRRLRVAC